MRGGLNARNDLPFYEEAQNVHADKQRLFSAVSVSFRLSPATVKVDVASSPPAGIDEKTYHEFHRVVRDVEREVRLFTAPDLHAPEWIYFDLSMGYGTSHRDTELPPAVDNVALFYGACRPVGKDGQVPTDLLLCGSTEHLCRPTASIGRLGSGTEWLDDVIEEINERDANGNGDLPASLSPDALAARRVNRPFEIARWVFDVIRDHHSPDQYTRIQGLARVLFIAPGSEYRARLVLATPLYVQFASEYPLGRIARRRLQRELAQLHGVRGTWHPQLPPAGRGRMYVHE